MELSDRFTTADDVVTSEVGGEWVLMDLASGQYFGLDPLGGEIWQWLDETAQSVADLCDRVEAEYDAPRAQIESDLRVLMSHMLEQGLIQPVSA